MLDGIESTAAETRDKIVSIRNLIDQTLETGKNKLHSKVYSKELIELLFHQPYTKTQTLVDAGPRRAEDGCSVPQGTGKGRHTSK